MAFNISSASVTKGLNPALELIVNLGAYALLLCVIFQKSNPSEQVYKNLCSNKYKMENYY